jgi:hypothetical protein
VASVISSDGWNGFADNSVFNFGTLSNEIAGKVPFSLNVPPLHDFARGHHDPAEFLHAGRQEAVE